MFIAMNRFKIVLGKEQEFESVWKNRDTHLKGVPGFKEFHLVKGNTNEEFTLYASHSIWNSKEDFINWGFFLLGAPNLSMNLSFKHF